MQLRMKGKLLPAYEAQSILVPRACVFLVTWLTRRQLDSNAEQRIICWQSFADHVVKSRPMKRKQKVSACLLCFAHNGIV